MYMPIARLQKNIPKPQFQTIDYASESTSEVISISYYVYSYIMLTDYVQLYTFIIYYKTYTYSKIVDIIPKIVKKIK